MSDRIDSRVAELLREERKRSPPPTATKARVFARVQESLLIPSPLAQSPRAASGVGSIGAAAKGALLAFALLGVGGALVAAYETRSSTPPPHHALVSAPQPAPATSVSPPPPAAIPEPAAAPPSAARVPSAARAAGTAAAAVDTLAAEHVVLDRARARMLSGDPDGALVEIKHHLALFPRGVLAEERDALRVEALVGVGRDEEARTAASRFHRAYPGSLLSTAVDQAVSSPP